MADYGVGDTFWAPEPLTVTMLWTDWPGAPVQDSWEVFEEIRRRTNVTIEIVTVPFRDAAAKRSLLISAGDAPDLLPHVFPGEEAAFGANGAVLEIGAHEDQMPHYRHLLGEWGLRDAVDRLRLADGGYYLLPELQEVSVPTFSLLARSDVLEEADLEPPETWAEVRTVLERLKELHPDSIPLADGFEGQALLNYAAHAFGTVAGWGFGTGLVEQDDGALAYAPTTPEYRELVTYLRGLVDDGLLDPASFTTRNDGAGTAADAVVRGETFFVSGSGATAQELSALARDRAPETSFELIQLAPPAGPAGPLVEPRGLWAGAMLTRDLAEDPRLLPVLQFTDWLLYSDGARELVRWGVEGETYTRSDDGVRTLEPGYALAALDLGTPGGIDLQRDLGYASNVLATGTESRDLMEASGPAGFPAYVEDVLTSRARRDPPPHVPLTTVESEQVALLATPLRDSVRTATLQFAVGGRDLAEWDDFVADLEAQGVERYVGLMEEARARSDPSEP